MIRDLAQQASQGRGIPQGPLILTFFGCMNDMNEELRSPRGPGNSDLQRQQIGGVRSI
jgi:hypothetical protein